MISLQNCLNRSIQYSIYNRTYPRKQRIRFAQGIRKDIRVLPVVAKKEFTLPDGSRLTYPVTQAMVVMQHDRGTSFDGYQNMNEFVQRAYKEIRNDLATEIFGKPLADLTHSERQIIYQAIPMNVSELAPKDSSRYKNR